jgi:hypothetical protein
MCAYVSNFKRKTKTEKKGNKIKSYKEKENNEMLE